MHPPHRRAVTGGWAVILASVGIIIGIESVNSPSERPGLQPQITVQPTTVITHDVLKYVSVPQVTVSTVHVYDPKPPKHHQTPAVAPHTTPTKTPTTPTPTTPTPTDPPSATPTPNAEPPATVDKGTP